MITAILIDDERNALEVLRLQLERHCPQVKVLAACDSGAGGVEAIRRFRPDLVFLDIEMPHLNGFDVLEQTRDLDFSVIFTTAYDQFAIKAFRVSALDYLLKPVDVTELRAAVEKARVKGDRVEWEEKISRLIGQLEPSTTRHTRRIALPVGDALQFMDPDEIVRCESESNYTHIFLAGGKKITLAKTLKEVEDNIGGPPFFRIHQSHLVNMNHILKFIKGDNAYVVMKDGSSIGVSRNRKEAFLESFRKA